MMDRRYFLSRTICGLTALGMAPAAFRTAAAAGAFPISLMRHFDGSAADRLADLLSRPGPRLAEAVQRLCALRQQE